MVHEHRGVPGESLVNPLEREIQVLTFCHHASFWVDAMIITHLPHGPTLSLTLHNVTLRHDIASHSSSTVSEQYPHLIFDNFSSRLGGRIKGILSALFPVPKEDAKRVMTFANDADFISFRHHVFVKNSHKDVQLAEVGPRFEAKRESATFLFFVSSKAAVLTRSCINLSLLSAAYEIRLGTADQTDADVEWLLRPYQRTAKKRNQL